MAGEELQNDGLNARRGLHRNEGEIAAAGADWSTEALEYAHADAAGAGLCRLGLQGRRALSHSSRAGSEFALQCGGELFGSRSPPHQSAGFARIRG
ncbi:hypothetical protein [Cohnella rhizosphaerae]|uniref:Uncharacterized protein n=1 Tax=Cohnella rhizosphaerae TaxID=1457232 RepID=A0A9X4KU90_9BACL|nr:hypothetical protein [Cohnella rhizosphaerae]MDG0808944.1 hypothetical protein [Cohnella rhizosphaerae]